MLAQRLARPRLLAPPWALLMMTPALLLLLPLEILFLCPVAAVGPLGTVFAAVIGWS